MSFAERVLKFSFSGATSGNFTAAGLRAAVSIQSTEGVIGTTAQVKIWGLTLDQMNTFSSDTPSSIASEIPDANLVIEAGDLGQQLIKVIDAPIWSSYIDLSGVPDSCFVVSCTGIEDLATPIASQSQPGAAKAEDLIERLCPAGGFTFQNNEASAVLTNHATNGSVLHQIENIAHAARFRWKRDGDVISIWPNGGTVDDVVIDVGPSTDPAMVGYPTYWVNGIYVTSLFNQEIQIGRQMNVVGSSIPKANGLWQIIQVQHDLTTMIPKGPWFTTATLAGKDT